MKSIGKLIAVYFPAFVLAYADDKIKSGIETGNINNSVIKPGSIFRIEKHYNSGFAGNRLDDRQEIVAAVSAAIMSVQACITGHTALNKKSPLLNTANVLMLAGALSNTKDRVTKRHVVDYLRIKDKVYNLSDFLIFAGALLDVVYVALHCDGN